MLVSPPKNSLGCIGEIQTVAFLHANIHSFPEDSMQMLHFRRTDAESSHVLPGLFIFPWQHRKEPPCCPSQFHTPPLYSTVDIGWFISCLFLKPHEHKYMCTNTGRRSGMEELARIVMEKAAESSLLTFWCMRTECKERE